MVAHKDSLETIGDRDLLKGHLDETMINKSLVAITRILEVGDLVILDSSELKSNQTAIDRMKTSPEDCDLLLVGGGSIISPPKLTGVKNIM